MAIDSIRPKPAIAPIKRNQKDSRRKQAPYGEKEPETKGEKKQGIIDERV